MLHGERPTIYGDGTQSRDFTYIDNVVHGNLLACKAPYATGETINLAGGGRILINVLVAQLNTILGTNLAPIHQEERPGDIKHSRADIAKARELLGFEPLVSFEEGLRQTVDWYRAGHVSPKSPGPMPPRIRICKGEPLGRPSIPFGCWAPSHSHAVALGQRTTTDRRHSGNRQSRLQDLTGIRSQ